MIWKNSDEIEMLVVDKKPALITINDFDRFEALVWYDFCQRKPNELLIKNIRFEIQSKERFIINNYKADIKN